MSATFTRLGMAILGCCLVAASSLAQSPDTVQPGQATEVREAPAPAASCAAPGKLGLRPRPLHQVLNDRGYCCYADLDTMGCGSWRSQCQFVFGSCRTFFRLPCAPHPGYGVPR